MDNDIFDLIVRSLPLFLKGAVMTLKVFLFASLISIALGCLLGIFMSRRMKIPLLSRGIDVFTFVTRAVPFYVQLLIVYFVIPDLVHIAIEPFFASVVALGICSSAYVAQFVKGAINSIPPAQWEAAFTLGYSMRKTLMRIILPQTIRLAIPSLNNEIESLLKSTSIVSSIGMLELTRIGMNLVSRELQPIPIFLSIAALYLSMSTLLNLITKSIERRLSYVSA